MKREIKFRVWDKNKKVFIPSDVFAVTTSNFSYFAVMIEDWEDYREGEYFYDYAQELSQFTGLHDKNGKEIYEGDVVIINHWKSSDLFDYSSPFVVEYYEGEINFKQRGYNNFKGSLIGKIDIEVIGNIYEHPHLLNQHP